MLANEVLRRIRSVVGADGPVALHEPVFCGNEWRYVKEALDSGWVSTAGERGVEFERALARAVGVPHAVALVSGTAGLHLALHLCGVRPGDEVLVPAFTFVAAANAVHYCGAVPHWVECSTGTLGIDPAKLAAHLSSCCAPGPDGSVNRTTGRPLRALVLVHAFGHPAEADAVREVCRAHDLSLVEDAAEALGSSDRGRHPGSWGRAGVLSFNGNKTITTGGGGAIVTSDEALAARARHLSTTAKSGGVLQWSHDAVGFNYRMPALNAALGCAQLEALPRLLGAKRALAEAYRAAFDGLEGVSLFREPAGAKSNYWLNLLLLEPRCRDERDAILEAANRDGVATRPAWTPMHRLPMYRDCPRMDLSITEDLAARLIALPSTPRLGAPPPA